MRIAAIILNYNDGKRVTSLAKKLHSYKIFDVIVLVDNKSKPEDYVLLERTKEEKDNIVVLQSGADRGFGGGTNVGLRYLIDKNIDYVLTISSDIDMSKTSIIDCAHFLEKHPEVAACSTLMKEQNKIKRNFYDIPSWHQSLDWASEFRKSCQSKKMYDGYLTCGYIRESAALYNFKHFQSISFFDEDFFMYDEGPSTGFSFREKGLKEAIILNGEYYIHNHTSSKMNRTLFKYLKTSRVHYLRKYCKCGPLKIFIFRIWWPNVFIK